MRAVVPLVIYRFRPHVPDEKLLSVAVIIHEPGSVVPACQTLAESVVPTILKRRLYDVPAVAVNLTVASQMSDPFTFFNMISRLPSI